LVERIFMLMEERGISAAQLTKEVSLTNGVVTQWKQGKQKPSTDAVIKIADYFGVTTDYLLKGMEAQVWHVKKEKESCAMDKTSYFCKIKISERLKALRKELGLTIDKLNGEIELVYPDVRYFSKMEREEFWEECNLTEVGGNICKLALINFFGYPDLFIEPYNVPEKKLEEVLPTDISLRIKIKMNEKGYTPKNVADNLSVDEISVISWSTGERMPNQRCLQLLNGVLELGDDMMRKYETTAKSKKDNAVNE